MQDAIRHADPQTEAGRLAAAVHLMTLQITSGMDGATLDDWDEAIRDFHSGWSQLKHDIKHGVK